MKKYPGGECMNYQEQMTTMKVLKKRARESGTFIITAEQGGIKKGHLNMFIGKTK